MEYNIRFQHDRKKYHACRIVTELMHTKVSLSEDV